MAQEATIKINLEQGNSKKTLKDLKKEVDAVDSSVDNLNKDFIEGQKEATKTTVSLKTQLKTLKDEMVQLDHNSPKFKQMAQEASQMEDKIKDVDAQVRLLSSDTKGLDGLVGAGQAVAGAFQASQGAMALMGIESEEVNKQIQNIIAVQGVMNGVQALSNALNKDAVAGMFLRTVITKVVTAAQWLLNIAMNANPIGLIIIGITLLIGAYFLLRETLTDTKKDFNLLTKAILLMLGPLGWAVLLYKELTKEVENLEEVREKQTKAEKLRHAERLKQIDRELKAFKKAEKDKQDNFDREIKRAKAEGKSVFALQLLKLESIKKVQEAELESYNLRLEAGIEHFKNQAKINGLSEDEFIKKAKEQGVDLLAIQEEALKGQQKFKDAIFDAESDIMQLKRDNREKNSKADTKATDKKVEGVDKETQRLIDAENRQKNELLSLIEKRENEFFDKQLTAQQREENAVQDKYNRLIELAQENNIEAGILEEAREQNLADIRLKFAEEKAIKDKEIADAEKAEGERILQEKLDRIDSVGEKAQEIINIVSSIQTLANTAELKRIKEKQKSGEQLSKAEIKRLLNDEKQKRAIAVAEIAIQTAIGIAKAVSAGAGLVFPANIPAIIAGVGAVLANVASATKILSAPLPSFDSASASGSDVAGSLGGNATENAPNINANQSGSTLLNEPPVQVVVLESDITGAQSNVSVIEQQATFG